MSGFSSAARVAAAASAGDVSLHPHGAGGRFTSTGGGFSGGSQHAAPTGRGKTSGVKADDLLHVHALANPKKAGSKSHARFQHYKNGMTVGDYVKAVTEAGHSRASALADLAWDSSHGYVSVVDAAEAAAGAALHGGDVEKGLAHALGGEVPGAKPAAKPKARDDTPPNDVPKEGTPERAFHDGMLEAAANFGPDASVKFGYNRYGDPEGIVISTGSSEDTVVRRVNVIDKSVDHSYFQLNSPGLRGSGAAKKFLADSVEAYKKLGIEKVNVHADIDVGGYAWLKYGFKPNARSGHRLADSARSSLNNLKFEGQVPADVHAAVSELLDKGDLHAVADVTHPVEHVRYSPSGRQVTTHPLGRALFLNSDWHGMLNLKDLVSMARFAAYTKPKE